VRDLQQVELPQVQLLLDLLKGGIADRAVVAELDEPAPLRRRRDAHDLGVFLVVVVVLVVSLGATQP
jgi:hypothetical protein